MKVRWKKKVISGVLHRPTNQGEETAWLVQSMEMREVWEGEKEREKEREERREKTYFSPEFCRFFKTFSIRQVMFRLCFTKIAKVSAPVGRYYSERDSERRDSLS